MAELPHAFQMHHVVVLVHGLDEPGDIWDELITALQQAGHTPLVFVYPNDQPIVDSAKLLTEQLSRLPATGVTSISLVAHSMGGLVSREMITNPQMKGYPTVTRLITVGTPHHGSELAHFQFVGELREQVVRLFSGNGILFGSVFDGAGEAKVDLLPGSTFLTTLNARPMPDGIAMTSIIGIASPVQELKIQAFEKQFATQLNEQGMQRAQSVSKALEQLVAGIGDGCVSLASAHLEGVTDEVTVHANHRTMLRTVPLISHGTPPAIPVILDRLASDAPQ
jgi:pimeloyl-ACP methyl ester carboxylesterase